MADQTLGERRVRFSVLEENDFAREIRRKSAELIDLVANLELPAPNGSVGLVDEAARLREVAIERFEEAAMWAVKAATA